ncbi:hypothetical protein B0G80_2558 [Paraburkholderia sp. BL6669N2]|uniref:hypothetical protein n=1 Tax=Paraburkholderia sp. BL6669N2 TaxID=1938807 RepID=UPI000E251D39|nr:hypothetical protein [Paraburkholderia sp. BL6669N2]REG59786.1 hypothetical protein B0G80_2558 [Paraburkholderia sp. BL6669N2]
MTRSGHASSSKPRRARTQITVEKIAQEAAALSKTHSKQFGYLAALARTAQTYLATGEKRQADFTKLATALADAAERYSSEANAGDGSVLAGSDRQ